MQIDLRKLTAIHFDLDLSPLGASSEERQNVLIDAIDGLAGKLETNAAGLRLSDVSASSAQLGDLRLRFGSVQLVAAENTLLTHLSSEVESPRDGNLRLSAGAERLTCPQLSVLVGGIEVSGQLDARLFELRVDETGGEIAAEDVKLQGFGFRLDHVSLVAPDLRAGKLRISWGEQGFQLRAERIDCNLLDIAVPGTVLRGEQLRADVLRVHDSDISVSALVMGHVDARMDLGAASADVSAEPADLASQVPAPIADAPPLTVGEHTESRVDEYHPDLPIFDWRLLDFVSGQLNVDVGMRIQLPLVTRRAVHELRVPIEGGAVDFRELERNLSALEESLLDFSVRDDQLILELGVPLLPTRGRGKPLVRWNLAEVDQELAARDRVRLAALARPIPSEPRESRAPQSSERSVASLRELALKNLSLDISVAAAPQPMLALLRSFSVRQLKINGDVIHRVEDEQACSQLRASMRELALDLDDFPVSGRRFDLRDVMVAEVPSLMVQFEGARPRSFEFSMCDVRSRSIDLGQFAV